MADTKPATAPAATVVKEQPVDTREEVRASVNLLKYKLNELERDSKRTRPFLSKSQPVAEAKFKAALAALNDFVNFIDKQEV